MKKVYFAGKFNLINDKSLSLEERLVNDFRSILLVDSYLLTYAKDNLKLNENYIYMGPFYCEQASNGDFTSTDCNVVLENEYKAVIDSDIYVVVFGDSFSVGSIVELNWALENNKEIVIIYKEEKSKYTIKSEYWFAIANALKRSNNVKLYKYSDDFEINKILNEVLK